MEIKTEKMIRVLRGGNISDLEYFFKDDDVMIDTSFVKEDLLLCKNTLITPAVTSLQHIGKMARIDKNYDNVVVGGFVLMLIPYINLDSFSEYMLFALSSYYHRSICRTITNKSGQAFYNLSREKLMNVLVPLPPLEEQKRIVEKIEELMPYVEKYDKAYTAVEELNKKFPEDMQKSILQYAIQGKLVEQRKEDGTAEELYQQIQEEKEKLIKEGKIKKTKPLPEITEDEIPFDIPETWKWVYINDVAFVTKLAGFEYTKYMSNAILSEGEIPLVRAKNIKPNSFIENEEEFISRELSEKLSRCALDARCILMTFIGAGIGEVAIFNNKRRNHLAPNVAKIVPHIDILYYLLYYFMSYTGQREIFKYMKKTAQPSLSMETIRKVIIPLPPLMEQKRIIDKIVELLPYIKQLYKKVD